MSRVHPDGGTYKNPVSYKVVTFTDGVTDVLPGRFQPQLTQDMRLFTDNGKRLDTASQQLRMLNTEIVDSRLNEIHTGMKMPEELLIRKQMLEDQVKQLSDTVSKTKPKFEPQKNNPENYYQGEMPQVY